MSGSAAFCQEIARTPLAHVIVNSTWLFPAIETIHLSAMVCLVGSITAFDLRLLGFAFRGEPVSELAGRLLPSTWSAFGVMAITGSLLFSSDAVAKYCPNPFFQIKMLLILLAGLNMSLFHFAICRMASDWDKSPVPPMWARIMGMLSVLLWAGVVVAGRWIGFAA